MATDVRVRPLTPEESPLLAALAERLFRDTYGSTHAERVDPYCAQAFSPAVQTRELGETGALALLVEVDGAPAGYAQLRRRAVPAGMGDGLTNGAADAMEIARFYVDRRHHGTGLAHRLMDAALDAVAASGAGVVWLQAAEYNHRAIAFYGKCGFRSVGRLTFDFAGAIELDHLLALEVGTRRAH